MSDDKKPPMSLDGDKDLLSEIDQWGDMFDNLHEEESKTGVHSPGAQPPPAAFASRIHPDLFSQLGPRADVELLERVAQVGLDRRGGDEQLLRLSQIAQRQCETNARRVLSEPFDNFLMHGDGSSVLTAR